MTTPAKLVVVRFYVDADVLGLARVLAAIRTDVTYPGDPGGRVKGGRFRPPCPVTDPGIADAVWIPETAKRDWLILTRDRHIREHPAEIAAVRANGARMVILTGQDAADTFHQLEALMCQWRNILTLIDRPGPFIVSVTRTTLREVPLVT